MPSADGLSIYSGFLCVLENTSHDATLYAHFGSLQSIKKVQITW